MEGSAVATTIGSPRTATNEIPNTSTPPNYDATTPEHTSIPISDITMPVSRPFQPLLVPEGARPLVHAPIKLVRRFVSIFLWVALIALVLLGGLMCTLPAKLHFFGLLNQGILTVTCLAFSVSVLLVVNVKRMDIAHHVTCLQQLCDGDESAAKTLALGVASDAASGPTLGTVMAMMDGVQSMDTAVSGASSQAITDAAVGTNDTAVSAANADNLTHGKSGEPIRHMKAQEGTRLLPKPPGPFEDKTDYSAAAAEGTLASVCAHMEEDPMYIFEQMIATILQSILSIAIVLPFLCLLAGYVMCKLGEPFSGTELILTGVVTAVVGPMIWNSIRTQAMKLLEEARATVVQLKEAAIMEQMAREREEQQMKEQEVELQRKKEAALVAEKENELAKLKAAKAESKKERGDQPNFFGIPLPKFELNPFQKKEGDENETIEPKP